MNKSKNILSFLAKQDRYINLHELGQGSAARVIAVFDTYLQRVVARKQMNSEHMDDVDVTQAFVNEIKLMGHLSHPGVLPVYDAGLDKNGEPAYVMSMARGSNLHDVLQIKTGETDGVALPVEHAVRILLKLSETLTYVHDRGILHLDLKPDNVMVGDYGEVIIMDWGAARIYNNEKYFSYLDKYPEVKAGIERYHERANLRIGTPLYMSPEQFHFDRASLMPASDIFSVGLMMYLMLTGTYPFKADTLTELVNKISNERPTPLHELNPDVPVSLSRICERMLAKNWEERYQSFEEVRKEIADYQRSAAGFPVIRFEAGEVIFNEGDPSDFVSIVVSGKVGIFIVDDGQQKAIAELGPGQPFGELAALTGNPRTATAIAIESSVVRLINKEQIAMEVEKLSPWVGSIIAALSTRIVEMNTRLLAMDKVLPP